jgi:hypothetical protein
VFWTVLSVEKLLRILAFHMITPYTESITPAFIETQLKKADMIHEFQVAALYMCMIIGRTSIGTIAIGKHES